MYAKRLDDYLDSNDRFNTALDVEKSVHRAIVDAGGWNEKKMDDDIVGTEFFGGKSLEEIITIINETLHGVDRLNDFSMRESQRQAHDKMVAHFKDGGEKFLLAAKMRFGKNHTLLNVIKTMNFKNVLVMTYKPYVYDSLIDDINNHIDFVNFDIVDYKDMRDYTPDPNKNTICLCSAQLALHKGSEGEEVDSRRSIRNMSKTMKDLVKIDWDMVAID